LRFVYSSLFNIYLHIYSQYLNITKNDGEDECNRKNVWGPRPDSVDRMLNGENHKTVLDDWTKSVKSLVDNTNGVKISDNNLSTFLKSVQEKTTDMFITSNVFDIYFELDLSKNKYVLEIPPGNIKIQKMVLCLNTVDDNKNNCLLIKYCYLIQFVINHLNIVLFLYFYFHILVV
jgi:hypothetical protein